MYNNIIKMNNEFLYGMIGGTVGVIISHPFDTIKTRIQSKQNLTITEAIKLGSLYRGLLAPLVGIMIEKSIVFGFYEKSKTLIKNDFINGIIGGLMCSIIVTPIDKIKIHYQNKTTNNLQSNKLIFRNLYNGFIPTVLRETPGFGIYFTTYNYLNDNYNNNKNLGKNFLFGSLSGLSAWLFIYPMDLIKTTIQSSNEKQQIKDVVKNIYNTGGLINFYKGFTLACMRCVPLHGGVFLGYEMSKRYL
jgi:solute carrier family 25 carnitine/acylcarnitine transporter 20/29